MSDTTDREKELLFEALERPNPEARQAYLKRVCGGDVALRERIEALVEAHASAEGFIPSKDGNGAGTIALSPSAYMAPLTECPGDSIGPYKLLQQIGEGGFGTVYMAEQRQPMKRRVALKVIKLGMDTKQVVNRFEAERQALAMMDHPNIARVFDAGSTDSGRPYFVMELVKGVPVTQYCDENDLSTKERLNLFITVCQAVQHAHQKGIIHRDIKPSNILVTLHDGVPVPKVIDFGIAKATQAELTEETVFTQFHQLIGTPTYMSPEQAEMSGLDIDTRTDVYSLGVLLYELLTGSTPIATTELVEIGYEEIRRRIREYEPAKPSTRVSSMLDVDQSTVAKKRGLPPRKLSDELRGDLDWVVLKALEKDRTRRYDSANGFAEDIKRFLAYEPVSAVAPSTFYLLKKYARRHSAALAFVGTVATLLVVGAVVSGILAVNATRARNEAVDAHGKLETQLAMTETARASEQSALAAAEEANTRLEATLTRSQFAAGTNLIETGQVAKGVAYLARSLRTDPTYWPAASRLISTLTERGFSLDDRPPMTHDQPIYDHVLDDATGLLVTRGKDYDIRVWDAWKSELLLEIPTLGERKMPRLSPDGKRLLCIAPAGNAQIFEPWAGEDPVVTFDTKGAALDAVFSPTQEDGLVVATRSEDGAVRLWNGETGDALTPPLSLEERQEAGDFLAFTKDGRRLCASFADGRLGVWDVPSGKPVGREIEALPNSYFALTPDSRSLVERGGHGKSLRFWDIETGTPRGDAFEFEDALARLPAEAGTIAFSTPHGHDFEFSPDGQLLLAVSHEDIGGSSSPSPLILRLFDTLSGELIQTIFDDRVTHHEVSLVSGIAASVVDMKRLIIRSVTTGEVILDRGSEPADIATMRFTPAGDRLLVALNDQRLILFDARTGDALTEDGFESVVTVAVIGSLRQHHLTRPMRYGPRLRRLEFTPDGETLLTVYQDQSVQLWDLREGLPLCEPIPGFRPRSVEFSGNGRHVLFHSTSTRRGSRDLDRGIVLVLGRDISAARRELHPLKGTRPRLTFNSDGSRAMLATSEAIYLLDGESGEVIRKFEDTGRINHPEGIPWLVLEAWLSPDGRRILTASEDKVKVFNAETGRLLHEFQHEGRVSMTRWVGNSSRILTYSGSVLQVRDLEDPDLLIQGPAPDGWFYLAAVSPDGRRIATCRSNTFVLDAETLSSTLPVLRHRVEADIYTVTFSPDSEMLLTGAIDGTVRVWDVESGELIVELPHGDWPRTADFSPDGRLVVTGGGGSYDNPSPAKVWDISDATAKLTAGPFIYRDVVQHAQFSSDGKIVVAGDRRGTTRLWDIETGFPVVEVLKTPSQVIRSSINPQRSRMFVATGWGTAYIHVPLPPDGVAVPDWLPELAESVVRVRINESGGVDTLTNEELRRMKKRVREPESGGFYEQWAEWLVADQSTRKVRPFGSKTVPEEIRELISEDSMRGLFRALRLDPTNAIAAAAIARKLVDYEELRTRDPDPHFLSAPMWYAERATGIAPGEPLAWQSKAIVLERLGRLAEALAAVERALELAPVNADSLGLKAMILTSMGQEKEAVRLAAQALAAPMKKDRTHGVPPILTPAHLAGRLGRLEEGALRARLKAEVPGRDPALSEQFIDLTSFYTEPISADPHIGDSWPDGSGSLREIESIKFDVRGTTPLSAVFTDHASTTRLVGIPVKQACHRLYFLLKQGGSHDPLHTRLRVNYSDGTTSEANLASPKRWQVNVATWQNDRPGVPVDTVDVLALPECAPSLLGITVQTGPDAVIATQPTSVKTAVGETARLEVGVEGAGPWAYQWFFNGKPMAGATGSTLKLPQVKASSFGYYFVRVRWANPDPGVSSVRSRTAFLVDRESGFARGGLRREVYREIPGGAVADLTTSPKFPHQPDENEVTLAFESPSAIGDQYGVRLSGYVIPPETGEYIFYLCSDDNGELYLSPNDLPDDKRLIASETKWSNDPWTWEGLAESAVSGPIRLKEGEAYYIEALMKENGGGDHLSVNWRRTDEPAPKNGDAPISGDHLGYRE